MDDASQPGIEQVCQILRDPLRYAPLGITSTVHFWRAYAEKPDLFALAPKHIAINDAGDGSHTKLACAKSIIL